LGILLLLLLLVSVNHDWQASRQCRLYPAPAGGRQQQQGQQELSGALRGIYSSSVTS
jgi:hypothetical protein